MLLRGDGAGRELDHETPLELLHMILEVTIDRGDLHQLVGIHFPEPLDVHWPPFFINAVVTVRVVFKDVIDLLEVEVLCDGVGAELLPPLDHIRPHLLRFLHVEFSGFEEAEHHVVVVVSRREELVRDEGLAELVDGLELLDVADVFDGDGADSAAAAFVFATFLLLERVFEFRGGVDGFLLQGADSCPPLVF